jgi:pteridine reductase
VTGERAEPPADTNQPPKERRGSGPFFSGASERRVALVTGGARRVGRAIALGLAGNGHDVVVHYHSGQNEAERTVEEIASRGSRAIMLEGDLRDVASCRRLVAEAADRLGGIDLLVNSAATMDRIPVAEVQPAQWDSIMALNLRAPFFLSQAFASTLGEAPGAIVNIADLAAFETWPAYVAHSISKAGVVAMTRSLARALAPRIRVNAVAPGAVLLPDSWSEADAAHLTSTTPLRKLGSPDDVVRAVLYLSRAEYVTGETLLVDGGRHVRC